MSDSSFDGELERMDSDTETETEYDTVPKDFDLKIKFKKENNMTYRVFEYRLKAGKNLPYKAVLKGESVNIITNMSNQLLLFRVLLFQML